MDGTQAVYLGRLVSKDNFRTFIYAPNGGQRLVESWEEFESYMQTGLWFALKEDAVSRVAVGEEHPKSSTRPKREKKANEKVELAFEVQDDFLPKD